MKKYFHIYHLFSNNFSILSYLLTSAINSVAAEWNLSFFVIGLINFIGAASYMTASLLFGRLGDKFGQKKILMIITMIFSLFNILGFFWSNVLQLVIFSIGLNLFFGTFFPQIEGLLSKRERELGIEPASTVNRFTLSWSTGNIIGMALGPFLIIKYPYITFGYGIALNIIASYLIRRDFSNNGESIKFDPASRLKITPQYVDFPRIKLYRLVYRITLFLSGLIYSAVLSLFPKVINMSGLPVRISGFLIVGANLGVLLVFITLGRIKVWIGNPVLSMIFLLVLPVEAILLFLSPSPYLFFLISLFAGMSYAVPYTYAIFYGLNSQDKDEGKQGGFHEAIIGTIFGIGPLIGGLAIQVSNSLWGLGIMAIMVLFAVVALQFWFIKKIRQRLI